MRTERTSRLPPFYTHVIGSLPRPQAVRDLLADDTAYAEHWLTFWNDALRNDYRGSWLASILGAE